MTKNLDIPVLKGLFEHKNKSEISFHMPGHKIEVAKMMNGETL